MSPTKQQVNTTVLLLSLAAFSSSASMRVLDSTLPKLAQDFDMSIPAVAHIVSIFAVIYGSFQLAYGPMADRYGKLHVMALACAIGTLGSITSALSTDFNTLLAARVLTALAVAGIIPIAMAWIGDAVSYHERQPVIARFLLGQIAGAAFGIAIGGFAADHFSWRFPFWLLTLCFGMVAFLLSRRAAQETTQEANREMNRETTRPPVRQGHFLKQLFSVVQQAWARRVLLIVFLEGTVLFGPLTFYPTHLHLQLGASLTSAGLLVMLFAGGGLIFALNSRFLVACLGEVGLALCGGLAMGAGLLIFAFTPIIGLAPPALLLIGMGFYMLHNTLQTNATQMAPEVRGSAVALFASSYFLGQSFGVMLASEGVDRWSEYGHGTTPVLAVSAVLITLIGASFAWLRHRRQALT